MEQDEESSTLVVFILSFGSFPGDSEPPTQNTILVKFSNATRQSKMNKLKTRLESGVQTAIFLSRLSRAGEAGNGKIFPIAQGQEKGNIT